MECIETPLKDVLVFSNQVFADERGSFSELFRQSDFDKQLARMQQPPQFLVQDNVSISRSNVLRGLHFQSRAAQGKLVSVLAGEVYDVAVDLRKHSPSFGQWFGLYLNTENRQQLWIPPGFAHGFYVTSEVPACVLYKSSNYYAPAFEHVIQWDDPSLAIEWPLIASPIVSERDRNGIPLANTYSLEFFSR